MSLGIGSIPYLACWRFWRGVFPFRAPRLGPYISSAANTVYMRTHEVGQIDRVDFDPATDKVSFLYASSREQYSLKDTSEGVEIANGGTGQKLILKGVSKAQLSEANFEFHFSQVRADHHITGAAVKLAEQRGCALDELPLADLQAIDARIDDRVFKALSVDASVAARNSYGGTAPEQVRMQVQRAREELGMDE